jgi:hypothetical protein
VTPCSLVYSTKLFGGDCCIIRCENWNISF